MKTEERVKQRKRRRRERKYYRATDRKIYVPLTRVKAQKERKGQKRKRR